MFTAGAKAPREWVRVGRKSENDTVWTRAWGNKVP